MTALASSTRLGSNEVVAQISAGGMGEVYQTHDTKLGRDVAIKVLPEAFAHDADRLSRFQREVKMLAALNHTNIATIHGLEQSGSTSCLVMELRPIETAGLLGTWPTFVRCCTGDTGISQQFPTHRRANLVRG